MNSSAPHKPNTAMVESMIRVNQAGEQGALDIYQGQLRVLKDTPVEPIIQEMYAQEQQHKQAFDQLMRARQVRPTFLSPLWRVAGQGLGMFTALLGPKAAMVCTEAVEEVICDHYQRQLTELKDQDSALTELITQCYMDEKNHQDLAIAHGSQQYLGYRLLRTAIKGATQIAIFLSKRI